MNETTADPDDKTPETLPGLPVRVTWPVGFTPMDGFPGVANPDTQASIVLHAFPAPFDELAAGMNRENLLKRGVRLDGQETLTLEGRRALLIRCGQSAQDVEVDKWILVLEGDGRTALLTATFPVREAPAMAAPLREALLTARWVDAAPETPTLRLGHSPRLRYATTTAGLDVYTPDGRFVPGQRPEAVMFAGYGMAPIRGEEAQRRFCTDRIGNLDDDLMGMTITTLRPITLDGLHGFEGQAVGTSRADGRRRAVYQVVLFEPDRYVILVGLTDEDQAEGYVPAFQAIAGGFAAHTET
jgi:hypothetical protein